MTRAAPRSRRDSDGATQARCREPPIASPTNWASPSTRSRARSLRPGRPLVRRPRGAALCGAPSGSRGWNRAHRNCDRGGLDRSTGDRRLLIARGARLCRYGGWAARVGIARVVTLLVSGGAFERRAMVKIISRGVLRRADEEILSPIGSCPRGAVRLAADVDAAEVLSGARQPDREHFGECVRRPSRRRTRVSATCRSSS